MQIDVSMQQGKVPVTVVQPHGDLDSSTYTELINKVRKLVAEGARDFVIDLGEVPFMSSAGMMAIHSLALLLRGKDLPDLESGRAALKAMERSGATGVHGHIKLLNPYPGVAQTLDKAGFLQSFEIFTDLQQAVASFAAATGT